MNNDEEKFASNFVYEDPTTANSNGPLYLYPDHFFYFDVNHLRSITDIHQTLAVPIVFQPTDVLPPFPKPIRNGINDLADLYARVFKKIKNPR